MVWAVGADAMGMYTREYYHDHRRWRSRVEITSYSSNWGRSAVNAVHGYFAPFFGINLAYTELAILAVGLGLDDPEVRLKLRSFVCEGVRAGLLWNRTACLHFSSFFFLPPLSSHRR